jgi:hypothetical protein
MRIFALALFAALTSLTRNGGYAQATPAAPPSAAEPWRSGAGVGITIWLDPALPQDLDPGSWAAAYTDAYRHAIDLLAVDPSSPPPIYLVSTRETLQALTGVAANGLTDYARQALYFVYAPRPNRLGLRHEAGHWVAAHAWSPPLPPDWINEGVAVLAQGRCSGYPIRAVAATLAAAGELRDPNTLAIAFRAQPELPAYFSAGAFVAYLHNRDPRSVQALWQTGIAATAAALDTTPAALIESWRAWVTELPAEQRAPDWVIAEGCRQ